MKLDHLTFRLTDDSTVVMTLDEAKALYESLHALFHRPVQFAPATPVFAPMHPSPYSPTYSPIEPGKFWTLTADATN